MVVTVFGDLISQHKGWVWLGSLINLLQPMGYNERLVRTAVYRLTQTDWLQVKKIGRRSYYRFTDTAQGHYEKAARRIYADNHADWDGSWILVSTALLSDEKKEELRKNLLWQGFNTLSSGLFAHPSSDHTSLDEIIDEQQLEGEVVVLSAKTTDTPSKEALKKLVKNRWNFDELEMFYNNFIEFYRPLSRQSFLSTLSNRNSTLIRLLLIHDYRRILLRDPDFPASMLEEGWLGHKAQLLVKKMYTSLAKGSISDICQTLENEQGLLTSPSPSFYKRFGGLPHH